MASRALQNGWPLLPGKGGPVQAVVIPPVGPTDPVPPNGYIFLLGADGAQLLGSDGAYLYGVA